MLGELSDQGYQCEYAARPPRGDGDYWVCVKNEQILLLKDGGGLPPVSLAPKAAKAQYLFSVSNRGFFLADGDAPDACEYKDMKTLRTLAPDWMAFGAITGYHLAYWYAHNRFCGACGAEMAHSGKERALCCPRCRSTVYPGISPAVIVGVKNKNKLLLTKYASGGYRRFALVAGFAEIGERLEDTVAREVYEETGLRVKDPRYFGSQPWGFSRSLLAGFFAELDGDETVALRDGELSEAVWTERADIPPQENTISLTSTMMEAFKAGRVQ